MRSIILAALLALPTVASAQSLEGRTHLYVWEMCGDPVMAVLIVPGKPPQKAGDSEHGGQRTEMAVARIEAWRESGQLPDGPTYRIEVPGECQQI